jgi:hypothetical protein
MYSLSHDQSARLEIKSWMLARLPGVCQPGRDLPRPRAARVEEATGGTFVRHKRETNGRRCSPWNGLTPSTPVEVSGRVSGIGRVDFNAGVLQFGSELNGQHIQCGLRSAISDEPERGEFGTRIASLRERTKSAGQVDDAA